MSLIMVLVKKEAGTNCLAYRGIDHNWDEKIKDAQQNFAC